MIKLVSVVVRRKKGMSKEAFKDYWLNKHAPLAKQIKEVKGYRINIAIKEPGKKAPPYEGSAEVWFDSYEDALKGLTSDAGKRAVEDTKNFIAESISFYTEEHVIV